MATSTLVKTLAVPNQPVCSLNGGRSTAVVSLSLPSGFKGMRISQNRSNVEFSISSMKNRTSRRGSIVCEAQRTALDVSVPDVKTEAWQEQVIDSKVPVLVEFWAPWCGPCRMMHPVIGKLSKSYEGKLKCFKLNTDENQEIATKYGIRSIPTVIIFKDGEKKDAIIGAVSESDLAATVNKFVGV